MRRSKSSPFLPNEIKLINTLSRLRLATREQLSSFTGIPKPTVVHACLRLLEKAVVDVHKAYKPGVLSLTTRGYKVAMKNIQGRWPSPAKIQNMCHRNEALIVLSQQHKCVELLPMAALYKSGLSPSVAEYGVMINKELYLLLVDDYFMSPFRVQKSWNRRHTPQARYFSLEAYQQAGYTFSPYWKSRAKGIQFFTTEVSQLKRHKSYLENTDLPATVQDIRPLWDFVV